MPAKKQINVKSVREWMDHCLKMQKALGSISPSAYNQYPGYNGLATAAKELGFIHREPVEQKDKSFRVSSVWKLEPVTDKHAEKLLKHYRERTNRIAAERYKRENPAPDIEEDEVEESVEQVYTQAEVNEMIAEAIRERLGDLSLPAASLHQPVPVQRWPWEQMPEVPAIEEQLLVEARQTNELLIRLLKCWQR